jgi:hypothetical protein
MKLYIYLGVVFLLSFFGAIFLPINEIFKGIFATPALLAMIGALFQLVRDNTAYESKLDLQRKQQIFNLGATSHMANVTFDKHVEFCEKYMEEVEETIVTLYRERSTKDALLHAGNLYKLRKKYSAWLNEDIGVQLSPFEDVLRKIGADERFIDKTINSPKFAEKRQERMNFIDQALSKVLGMEYIEPTDKYEEEMKKYLSEEEVKKKIRKILDIEDLVSLRKGLIKEACTYIKNT